MLGDKEKHTTGLNDFEVVISPVGPDGYPEPLWDKTTGKMNREVATLRSASTVSIYGEYTRGNWSKIGRDPKGNFTSRSANLTGIS